ncbi:MAG: DUF819 family protein [Spongiibacter sp.]
MTDSFIAPTASFTLLVLIFSLVAFGLWLERRPRVGQFAVLLIILLPALLSSLGVLPRSAPVYGLVAMDFVPLALPMLLFQADMRKIWRESGRVLIAFLGAAGATLLGCFIALPWVELGSQEGVWAGILTAGFIGGSVNAGAVAVAMDKATDPMMGVAVAAVFAVAVPFLALLLALPEMPRLWRLFSNRGEECSGSVRVEAVKPAQAHSEQAQISAQSLCAALALSGVICVVSGALAEWLNYPPLKYLAITLISVCVASLFPRQLHHLNGHYELGQILIYCFFAVVGVQINFVLAYTAGAHIMAFTAILLSVHLLVLSIFGRLLKLSGPELLVASNACILSAPTAAAMAVAKGWRSLITPALLCGVLGYAIANVVGIGLAELL